MYVKVASPQISDDDIEAVVRALKSGRLTSGPIVKQFEKEFAEYIGTKYAVSLNSGTAALHAALAAIGVGPGDEVVVPALTFFSTVTAVIHAGAVPVFADISLMNFSLDPLDFKQRITPRTKAVIPVHYFGHSADIEEICNIAKQNGIRVIEDCAQAHGTLYRGKKVGSFGDLGAFSLFATKHITTGEGGMVTTDNEKLAQYILSFRSHGMHGRNDHVILGYNYRLPEMAGALGLSQLKRLDDLNKKRVSISEKIVTAIKDVDWLAVPSIPSYVYHTYFWCHIFIDEAKLGMKTNQLIELLRSKGIETRNRYVEPLYRQPLLNDKLPEILRLTAIDNLPDYGGMQLPNVEKAAGRVIGLPNRPDMTMEEVDYLVTTIKNL